MVSRKRTRSEVDTGVVEASEQQQQHEQQELKQEQHDEEEKPGLLHRLRNCWEFANLMQYIHFFGRVLKIDEDFDIDAFENECLKPGPSEKLLEVGLCLLKFISSRRDLTYDNFDEHTRRQYNRKAPHLPNPFGYDEEPAKFTEFDIFLKLRVLHQLSVWTFTNPDNIRRKMPDMREQDQIDWRIEEIGYDRKGRSYYVLDDNRLYRRTDPPLPPPKPVKPKANRKSARAMRASKRRKLSGAVAFDEDSDEENNSDVNGDDTIAEKYTGEYEWECIAITLAEYQQFADSIRNTKDADEKVLRNVLRERVIPFMEKIEEEQQRKRAKREKELVNLQLLAGAKRSSRIAQKAERERQEREASEAARKRETDLLIAHKEQEKQKRMEEERRSRVMTREQRMRDREQKRLLHEAELERIAEEQKKLERGESRMSERHLQAEMERQKKSLEELTNEDHWFFDCSGCGVHGENLDDGSHSVACEKCNVWQHSKCLGIAQEEAEREDFHFVCNDCKRREEEAKFPKLPKLRFRIGASSSPPPSHTAAVNGVVESFHEHATAPSPVKREKAYEAPPNLTDSQPILPPPSTSHTVSYPSPSSSHPMSARQSTSPRTLHSPSKGTNGFARSVERLPKLIPNQYSLPPSQQTGHNGSFTSQRPSSSHSVRSTNLPSPIQNRPSMSPTQGNRDVGPLVGFPSAAVPNDSTPWTPFAARGDTATTFPSSSSVQNGYPSFSAATPGGAASFGHPRSTSPSQSSQGIPSSGISPTKQSPRPVASGSLVGAPVVPPIQKLEPSPKLMGRSSPDAPIPPPVKSMSLDQEGRRQREHALLQARTTGSPLGPSAVGQQELLQQQPYSLSSSSVQRDKDVNGQ